MPELSKFFNSKSKYFDSGREIKELCEFMKTARVQKVLSKQKPDKLIFFYSTGRRAKEMRIKGMANSSKKLL
jgi:cysteine sulfinate desulfinase/cysteine desulfurase-like protein